MRLSGRGLIVVSQVGAMTACLSSVAWAGVVQTPGNTQPRVGAIVWDDTTSLSTALQGEGLVFDILDVTGAAGGNAEFTCGGCDVDQVSVGNLRLPGATTPSTVGGGGSPVGSPGRRPGAHGSKSEGAKKATSPESSNSFASKHISESNGRSPADSTFTPPESFSSFAPPESFSSFAPPENFSSFAPSESFGPTSAFETPSASSIVPTTDDVPGGPTEGSGSAAIATPEPGSILLLGSGLLGLAAAIRRRRISR